MGLRETHAMVATTELTSYAIKSTNGYDMTDRCVQLTDQTWTHAEYGWSWHSGACWEHGFGSSEDPNIVKVTGIVSTQSGQQAGKLYQLPDAPTASSSSSSDYYNPTFAKQTF